MSVEEQAEAVASLDWRDAVAHGIKHRLGVRPAPSEGKNVLRVDLVSPVTLPAELLNQLDELVRECAGSVRPDFAPRVGPTPQLRVYWSDGRPRTEAGVLVERPQYRPRITFRYGSGIRQSWEFKGTKPVTLKRGPFAAEGEHEALPLFADIAPRAGFLDVQYRADTLEMRARGAAGAVRVNGVSQTLESFTPVEAHGTIEVVGVQGTFALRYEVSYGPLDWVPASAQDFAENVVRPEGRRLTATGREATWPEFIVDADLPETEPTLLRAYCVCAYETVGSGLPETGLRSGSEKGTFVKLYQCASDQDAGRLLDLLTVSEDLAFEVNAVVKREVRSVVSGFVTVHHTLDGLISQEGPTRTFRASDDPTAFSPDGLPDGAQVVDHSVIEGLSGHEVVWARSNLLRVPIWDAELSEGSRTVSGQKVASNLRDYFTLPAHTLDVAHRLRIVHGDVKPANACLARDPATGRYVLVLVDCDSMIRVRDRARVRTTPEWASAQYRRDLDAAASNEPVWSTFSTIRANDRIGFVALVYARLLGLEATRNIFLTRKVDKPVNLAQILRADHPALADDVIDHLVAPFVEGGEPDTDPARDEWSCVAWLDQLCTMLARPVEVEDDEERDDRPVWLIELVRDVRADWSRTTQYNAAAAFQESFNPRMCDLAYRSARPWIVRGAVFGVVSFILLLAARIVWNS